ncbi:hypothetical protein BpHYR1_003283, partial [Brachionus plicatilis]
DKQASIEQTVVEQPDQYLNNSIISKLDLNIEPNYDFEIPIYIQPYSNNESFVSLKDQSHLTQISDRLNLDLDSLVNSQERITQSEDNSTKCQQSERFFTDFSSKIEYFNSLIDHHTNSNVSSFQNISKTHPKDISSSSSSDSNQQDISIHPLQLRPLSTEADFISDDEPYMDRSFATNDEFSDSKRFSSLDPSISNDYELNSYKINISKTREINNVSFESRSKNISESRNIGFNNPFYENIQSSKNHTENSKTYKFSSNNPFRNDVAKTIEPLSVQNLINIQPDVRNNINNQPQKSSIPIFPTDLSIPIVQSDAKTIKIESLTEIKITDECKQRSQERPKELHRTSLVKSLNKSDDELLFRDNLDEIKHLRNSSEIDRSASRQKKDESKSKQNTQSKKENGFFSVFNRIINVFKAPFKSSDKNKSNQKSKQKEFKRSLISSDDEDDDKEIKVFTISDIKSGQSKFPWTKSKETKTLLQRKLPNYENQRLILVENFQDGNAAYFKCPIIKEPYKS